ncbi:MAG: DUF5103 domain-containing protein [Opitutaceae bacterium]|nr:DUF5103 domain-containing protein [Cytophagales bacterium]
MKRLIVNSTYFLIALAQITCVPPPTSTGTSQNTNQNNVKTLIFEDNIYEDRIKTVLLYPAGSSATSVLNPPIINRSTPVTLVLEFDDLGKQYCNYYAKLYHCNANWTRSSYSDLQFVSDYNETLIQDYTTSINTKVRFSHYRYTLPRLKLTGNYVLVVYRNGNQQDLALSRRIIVYDPVVSISPDIQYSTTVADRNSKQQINFILNYGNLDLVNPQDIKVVVRQNQRWDNAITLKQPLYIQYDKKQLDYSFFDGQNRFPGDNEFRYFDIRNLRTKGMNVAEYATSDTNNTILLVQDKNRSSITYSELVDINGKFVIQRFESQDPGVEGDYANVLFSLNTPPDFEGDIYIAGQLTDWKIKPKYKMEYNIETGLYSKNLLLKQGFYNYQYILLNSKVAERNYFEGDFSQTENYYDIIVYYRPANQFNDIVIGYESVNYRGRN